MSSRRACPIAAAAARSAAAATLEGYSFELLQSTRAADRIGAAYGIERPIAADLVEAERRRRADDQARARRRHEGALA